MSFVNECNGDVTKAIKSRDSSQENPPFAIIQCGPQGRHMTKKIAVLLWTALVCSISSQGTAQESSRKVNSHCELTQDDYAVFAALITGLGPPEDPEEAWQGKEILIVGLTAAGADMKSHWGGWGVRSKSKAASSRDTIMDFERKARSSCVLKPQFGDAKSYKIIAREELDEIFKKRNGSWENFYEKYPEAGGVWTFSRPGYNSARNEALLSVSHTCGMLCGTGHLYFLAKQDNQWTVLNRLMLWIS
jgi:hypothetical protein